MSAFKRSALTFGITFCISFLIFGIVAYILMSMFLGPAETKEPVDTTEPDDLIVGFDDVKDTTEITGAGSFTVLLVGTDYQPRVTPDAPSRADLVMLVRFSTETNTVVYLNIPAVTKTTVNGVETTLSEAYTEKGVEYLMEKVQALTGISVNYYAKASVGIFDDIIDSLGGIEYPVPVDMEYEDESQDLVIDLEKGTQQLNGKKALDMLRYRSDSYSDRILRNTQFFRTLVEKYTESAYREEAKDLFETVFNNLESNFTEDDLLKHLDTIYSYSSYEGKILTFPGVYKTVGDNVYFEASEDEAMDMMAEYKNY